MLLLNEGDYASIKEVFHIMACLHSLILNFSLCIILPLKWSILCELLITQANQICLAKYWIAITLPWLFGVWINHNYKYRHYRAILFNDIYAIYQVYILFIIGLWLTFLNCQILTWGEINCFVFMVNQVLPGIVDSWDMSVRPKIETCMFRSRYWFGLVT